MIKTLAVWKLRLWRGGGYLQFFINIGVIFANVGIYHEFIPEGVTLTQALVIGGGGYVVISALLGYVDQRWGIWKAESAYSTGELNPHLKEIGEKVNNIDSALQKR